eukprot:1150337-Amphidinium_carterae.1
MQSMLRSVRSSRMISISNALFNKTRYWLSVIVGYIRKGVKSHIRVRRSAFLEPTSQSQDAHPSVQRESELNQYEIKIKECKRHVKHTEFYMLAEQCHLQGYRCHPGVTTHKGQTRKWKKQQK